MKKETKEEFRQLIEERIKNRERVGFFNSIKTKIVFLVFVVVIFTAVHSQGLYVCRITFISDCGIFPDCHVRGSDYPDFQKCRCNGRYGLPR